MSKRNGAKHLADVRAANSEGQIETPDSFNYSGAVVAGKPRARKNGQPEPAPIIDTTQDQPEPFNGDQLAFTREDYQKAKARCTGETLLQLLQDHWFPDGKRAGNYFRIGNVDGDLGNSLRVHLDLGVWEDPADPDLKGSDIVDLNVARLSRLEDRQVTRPYALHDLIRTLDELGAPTAPIDMKPLPAYRPTMPIPKDHRLDTQRKFNTIAELIKMPRYEKVYTYRDAVAEHLLYRFRCKDKHGKKFFLPLTLDADGRTWKMKDCPIPRPLYGLDQLAARPNEPVLLVEGEKSADAAAKLLPEMVAITWPGGADGVETADFAVLSGRDCTIWPDADDPGRKAGAQIRNRLMMLKASRVRVVDTSALPAKWDLAEPIPDGVDILALLRDAAEPAAPENRFVEPAPERNLVQLDLYCNPPQFSPSLFSN